MDILLLEPTRDDLRMFSYNIMRYSARRVVAEHGYRTALAFFRRNAARHRRLFAKHGIELRDPRQAPDEALPRSRRSRLARTLEAALDRLEARIDARRS